MKKISNLDIWGVSIAANELNAGEREYIDTLPKELPDVHWVWREMDKLWYALGLNNKQPLSNQNISSYYEHPVWLMNGIFSSADPVSKLHRQAISEYIKEIKHDDIADYGGGFGELATIINKAMPDTEVSIIEPYPSSIGISRIQGIRKIKILPQLSEDSYDVVIAQDVLEHVERPVRVALDIAKATRNDGYIIFANCFYPVIQCHLPSTFHLRHTFPWVMRQLGLVYIGTLPAADHVQIFKKKKLNASKAMFAETLSKLIGPIVNFAYRLIRWVKK